MIELEEKKSKKTKNTTTEEQHSKNNNRDLLLSNKSCVLGEGLFMKISLIVKQWPLYMDGGIDVLRNWRSKFPKLDKYIISSTWYPSVLSKGALY